EQFVTETKKIKVGDKLDESTDMGPLISETEAKRVEQLVKEAVDAGAKLLTGGKRNGAFYEPTVLVNVKNDATIVRDEIFGPVVSLFAVDSLEEAVERANDVPFGLQAGIFTENISQAFHAIYHLEVGGIMVNDSSD